MDNRLLEREIAWVRLADALGARSRCFKSLIKQFGAPEAILSATREELLSACPDIGKGVLAALAGEERAERARRTVFWCHQSGVRLLTPSSHDYPRAFAAIAEPPIVLYVKGDPLALRAGLSIGVVGPRESDEYGESITYKLSFELAAAGATIVSGMAQGVDGIAASAALDAGGSTVAVLGCGIDIVYPREHKKLAAEIAARGAVITEFAPGTRPNGWNFPIRNRLISALSDAVLVTEAEERSGSLITARCAAVQGKAVFAVPGDITSPRSTGTNLLLRRGAELALCGEDVLSYFRALRQEGAKWRIPPEMLQYSEITPEKLHQHGVRTFKERQAEGSKPQSPKRKREAQASVLDVCPADLSMLDPRQRDLYLLLPDTPFTVDAAVAAGFDPGEAISAMTVYEICGLVTSLPGGVYVKK